MSDRILSISYLLCFCFPFSLEDFFLEKGLMTSLEFSTWSARSHSLFVISLNSLVTPTLFKLATYQHGSLTMTRDREFVESFPELGVWRATVNICHFQKFQKTFKFGQILKTRTLTYSGRKLFNRDLFLWVIARASGLGEPKSPTLGFWTKNLEALILFFKFKRRGKRDGINSENKFLSSIFINRFR